MNTQAKISLFRSYTDATPVCELTIFQFYENVVDCDYWEEVAQVRAGDKSVKKQLPGVTISGTFTNRGNSFLKRHSGFIAIDLDASDNPNITDWAVLRDTLGAWDDVLMAALSVSGRGVFLIIPIAYPSRHREHYKALEKDFKELGLVTDKQCKDLSRLRGISSDPQATWNPKAKPYQKVIIEQHTHHTTPTTAPELQKLIGWCERKHGSFIRGNRNNFITQLAGACHRLGISQSEVENHLKGYSQGDFSENSINATIRSIYNNKQWVKF
jgi:hypothetical protein